MHSNEEQGDLHVGSWRYRRVGLHVFVHVYPHPDRIVQERSAFTFRGLRVSPRGVCRYCGMVQWTVARKPPKKGKRLWLRCEDAILPWGTVPQFDGRGLVRPMPWPCDKPMPEALVEPMQRVMDLTEQAIAQERLAEAAVQREGEITDEIMCATGTLITPLLDMRDRAARSAAQKFAAAKRRKGEANASE